MRGLTPRNSPAAAAARQLPSGKSRWVVCVCAGGGCATCANTTVAVSTPACAWLGVGKGTMWWCSWQQLQPLLLQLPDLPHSGSDP
jgi:hypothetical protein